MAVVLTQEELKELTYLCRTGRLYEIEKWIASGKSLGVPPDVRKTILQTALETGFHSLIELVARHEGDQAVKDAALQYAVRQAQMDVVELLLTHGANLKSVPFLDALLTWQPKLIRFFLAHGVDAIKDAPFAQAFGTKIRTAIGPFLEYKREHPELAPQLQEQLDCALRHFCGEGNLKWVSLLMWAGGDPRTIGPVLDKEYTNDPECFTTALEEACYSGNVEILKRLKPDPGRDDLAQLLHKAALLARKNSVEYLLGLGANPNDKANGGSSAIDTCLTHFTFESFDPYRRPRSKYAVWRTLGCIQALLEHGAQWRPDSPRDVNSVRRSLYECEPDVTVDVLQLLIKNNGCSQQVIQELLKPPRMKEHLASKTWHLARLKLELADHKQKQARPPAALLARFDREKLYEQVWSQPMRTVAQAYAVSDVWLAKVCRRLKIPVPGRGYWAKKAAGALVGRRPKLPQIESKIGPTLFCK